MTRRLTSTIAAVITLLVLTGPAPAAAACPNEQLRTESNSTALPECRAYELVTPGNHNAQGNTLGLTGQAVSADGSAVSIESITELPGSPVGGQGQDVARRSSTGWTMGPLEPANDEPENVHSETLGAAGEGFSTVFLGDDADLVPGDHDVNIDDVFAVGTGGELSWISQGLDGGVGVAPASSGGGNLESSDIVGGATTNLSHIVFQTPYGSLTTADTHEYGAEIYDRVNESATELVGVLPNNAVPVCGASLGGQQPSGGAGYYGSVSQSGTTVFFQSPDPVSETTSLYRPGLPACPAGDFTPPQLYVRLNDHETIEASAAAPGVTDTHGEQEARYDAATPEGTDVLFTSKGALTSNANTHSDTTDDLYEYNVAEKSVTDISSEGLVDPNGSQVQGVLGMSDNGGIIYFVAHGKLTSEAIEGANNLYVSNTGHLSYIAALSSTDSSDWEGITQRRSSRLTPDGTHLLLSSTDKLATYENAGKAELYLYTLGQPGVTCISCGASGTTATGAARLGGQGSEAFPPAANMTPNGATIFFQSEQALVPAATEGVGGVYGWHEGTVSLIAPGGLYGAEFVGASTDGSSVFVKTNEVLTPQDETGGEAEIYEARVNGGFSLPPAPAKPCGSNSECRGAVTSLSSPSIASTTPGAIGNLSPAATSTEAALRITAHSAKTISVMAPSAGTFTLSGGGVTAAKQTASKAGSYSLPVTLTKAERRLLAQRGHLTLSVTVRFVPNTGKASTATAKITIKSQPKKKSKSKKK